MLHELEAVEAEAVQCTKCRLAKGRTQVVWMDGNPDSDLMFIGEAPGFHEDKQGRPFVGAAGQLLNEMLSSIGMDRTKCSVVNVLKCRPPGNRDPMPDEIETCKPYLEAQIRLIRPRVIVPLGNFATRFILNKQVSISRVRGQRFEAHGASVVPTFHPAAILRGGGQQAPTMPDFKHDFELVRSILDEPVEEETILEPAKQQSLF
jgi:uracil-DNA glycosylase family 4